MSHKIVRSLFEARLAAWAKMKKPMMRIAHQNVGFKPVDGEIYLRAFLMPARTGSDDLAGEHRIYTGIFQITIVTPAGVGSGAGEGLAEEISLLFALNDRLSHEDFTVLVMTPVELGPEQQEDTGFALPVSFQYRADTE